LVPPEPAAVVPATARTLASSPHEAVASARAIPATTEERERGTGTSEPQGTTPSPAPQRRREHPVPVRPGAQHGEDRGESPLEAADEGEVGRQRRQVRDPGEPPAGEDQLPHAVEREVDRRAGVDFRELEGLVPQKGAKAVEDELAPEGEALRGRVHLESVGHGG